MEGARASLTPTGTAELSQVREVGVGALRGYKWEGLRGMGPDAVPCRCTTHCARLGVCASPAGTPELQSPRPASAHLPLWPVTEPGAGARGSDGQGEGPLSCGCFCHCHCHHHSLVFPEGPSHAWLSPGASVLTPLKLTAVW